MKLSELKKYVLKIGQKMVAGGFSAPTDGNISFRFENQIFITRSLKAKDELTEDDLVQVDLTGKVIGKNSKASTELALHLKVYREREDVQAVVHAHPVFATAFAVAGRALDRPILSEIVSTVGVVPLAKYGTPSTEELPNSISPFVKKTNAILLENHGVMTYGKSLEEAWFLMQKVEHASKIETFSLQLGEKNVINPENVKKLLHIRKEIYHIVSPMINYEG
jgi:L-fuculose-phosphate aldolase